MIGPINNKKDDCCKKNKLIENQNCYVTYISSWKPHLRCIGVFGMLRYKAQQKNLIIVDDLRSRRCPLFPY